MGNVVVNKYPGDAASSLGDILVNAGREFPGETFFVSRGEEFSFDQVFRRSLAIANALRERDIPRNSKIMILLDNRPEFFFAFFGILFSGCTAVPISPKSTEERVAEIFKHSDSVVAIIDAQLHENLTMQLMQNHGREEGDFFDLSEVDWSADVSVRIDSPDHYPFFQYTSASTGASKGVMISHDAVLANIKANVGMMQVDRKRDSFSSFMPLYHDMGLVGFGLAPLYCAVPLLLYQQDIRSIYNWLSDIGEKRPTISGASNTILYLTRRVISDPGAYDLSSLRMLVVGSEPIYAQTVNEFQKNYSLNSIIVPAYGLAEATLCVTMCELGRPVKTDTENVVSCGKALDGIDLYIEKEGKSSSGEIMVKSPSLMSGYYKNEEETRLTLTENGYLRTGDIGYLDDEGDLFIIGRKKNLIIRNGENILPYDLEAISVKINDVRAAAVIGFPSRVRENYEEIVLFLELSSKKKLYSGDDELRKLQKGILHEAKQYCSYLPDRFVFLAPGAIPFSPNGKLQHIVLREKFSKGQIAGIEFDAAA